MYMIGVLKDGKNIEPLTNASGRIRKFKTGKTAAKAARAAERFLGVKVQPRPLVTEDWRERESAKFAREEYKRIKCWDRLYLHRKNRNGYTEQRLWSQWYPDHYAHVSVTKKAMVAYIPDEAYGVSNRKLVSSPGAYLQKYFPEMDSETVTYWARNFGAMFDEVEVKFATEPKDIARVYMRGPGSCMSGALHKYCSTPHHPTEVYGAGDLALAYLDNVDGHIVARGLVWPEKKIFGRIYGDRWRLEQALLNRDYKNAYDGQDYSVRDAWIGAKLLKLKSKDGMHVMPYLDVIGSVRDGGKHWILGRNGWGASNTNGLLLNYNCSICGHTCTPIDEDHDADNPSFHWHENRPYCITCFEARYAQCEYTGDWHRRSEMVEVENGHGGTNQWHVAVFRRNGFLCALSHKRYHLQWRVTLSDGRHASSRSLPDSAICCSAKRDIWHIPDVTKCPSGINCCQITDEMRAEIKKKEEQATAIMEKPAEVVASVSDPYGIQHPDALSVVNNLLSTTTLPGYPNYVFHMNIPAVPQYENDGEYHDEND